MQKLPAASLRQACRWTGDADHGVSESIYRRDPDEGGVEPYRDKPGLH
jgi:catechol-2,3-dioxygenase